MGFLDGEAPFWDCFLTGRQESILGGIGVRACFQQPSGLNVEFIVGEAPGIVDDAGAGFEV